MRTLGRGGMATAGRGAFILLEGVDRAGKTTQARMLVQHLQKEGFPAELLRFPDRTSASGKLIDEYLQSKRELTDEGVHKLFSDNRWEKRDEMLRKLEEGKTLVVDRYAYSGVAFTAAKGVPGLDLEWCKAPDAGLLAPDLIFFLHLSIEEANRRGGFGEERYEREEFQRRVVAQFEALRDENWNVVDAARPLEDIHADLCKAATAAAEQCRKGGVALRTLW